MRIAILGATSQIARDFTHIIGNDPQYEMGLFSRRPSEIENWAKKYLRTKKVTFGTFQDFENCRTAYDAVINFVGSGDPAQTALMGADVLEITVKFDQIVYRYLKRYPSCRYIFLSSGAVYGGEFQSPVNDDTKASFAINHLSDQDWYGLAKFYAEVRHRAASDMAIIDIRVFNYFSYSSNIEARFLITDALRSIRDRRVFLTSQEDIFRDYIGPKEIAQVVIKALKAKPENAAIDCYSLAPIGKLEILEGLHDKFGLNYKTVKHQTGLVATKTKLHYYSTSRKAFTLFDFVPQATSLQVVLDQANDLLNNLTLG